MTGLTDAEGCFTIKFTESNEYKQKWRVQAQFQIKLHERDLLILNRIKDFFGVGTIVKDGKYLVYTIKTVENLTKIIIPHFQNFPLLSKKSTDFLLFKQIVEIMVNKGHLVKDGLQRILSLRANLNLGMSIKLKENFPEIVPVPRAEVTSELHINPNWLTGFIDGEGCFFINLQKYNYALKDGRKEKVWLTFQVTQHSRDLLLMQTIVKYLNCGRVRDRYSTPAVDFIVNSHKDITTNIITLLEKYPLQTVKQLDYKDFCKAAEIIRKKEHLTLDGMVKIKTIKEGMNTKRLSYS